ncbi:MAG: universal stress protein [Caldimicrobium sp.]
MPIYEKILVGIDGSEESFNALKNALFLGKQLKAEVFVQYVIPVSSEVSSALSLFIGMKDLFKKGAESILKKAQSIAEEEGISVNLLLEEGDPSNKIVDMVYAKDIGLLVMGKSGKGGFEKALLGSTASRVIGLSPVDVLIIPKNSKLNFKKILVPVDGSKYSEEAVQRAIDFATYFKSSITLLSVVEIPIEFYETFAEISKVVEHIKLEMEEFLRKMKMKFTEKNLEVKSILLEGIIKEKILDVAKEEEADLIIMGSHGKTGLKRLLMGSTTEKVLNLWDKPVLVVKRGF